jgi:hypothetical protein
LNETERCVANASNASLRRYQKMNYGCGQCFRKLEKFPFLFHCSPTCCGLATEQPAIVAFWNARPTTQAIQPAQCEAQKGSAI